MTRNGIQFRRADHLRYRMADETRDSPGFKAGHLVPVRKEGARDNKGVISPANVLLASCLENLIPGDIPELCYGPWKERRSGWSVRYTRPVYLVKDGNVFEGTDRRDDPPVV